MNDFDRENLCGEFAGIGFTMIVEEDKMATHPFDNLRVDTTDHDLYHEDPDECYEAFLEWEGQMFDWLYTQKDSL